MKNKILAIAAIATALSMNATAQNTFPASGNVGVGTSTPVFPFTIAKDIQFDASHTSTPAAIRAIRGETNNYIGIFGNHDMTDGPSIFMWTNTGGLHNTYSDPGSISIGAIGTVSNKLAFQVYNWSSSTELFRVNNNGDLGINGDIKYITQTAAGATRNLMGNSQNGGLHIFSNADETNSATTGGSSILLFSNSTPAPWGAAGSIRLTAGGNTTDPGPAFVFDVSNNATFGPIMYLYKNGKVAIGDVWPNTPNDYKLYVQKGILTERVKVAMSSDLTNWSDFVFADDYKLKSLSEVENYIGKHKHLPEIPSTAEVQKDGIDLADMDAKLLQKIEELTLYVIQQQKEINNLKKQIRK